MITRRRILTMGLFGTAGFWAVSKNQLSARMLRNVMGDPARKVVPSPYRPDPATWDPNKITAAWLGHSTVLINFYGVTVLTDPVLFRRVGANLPIGTVGPKRYVAPALEVTDLPPIDVVVLSHAHMDHFDVPTLRCLPSSTTAITASETGGLFRKTRMRNVHELGWGSKRRVDTPHGRIEVKAFEVKHWGARWRHDTHRGYNGYVLRREGKSLIFGGDTAYSPTFADLKSRGPYEFALMPIGAYNPWLCSHCTPEEAVRMANAAGAQTFLPIHHQTFPLGRENVGEPLERLHEAIEPERVGWRSVGQTFVAA